MALSFIDPQMTGSTSNANQVTGTQETHSSTTYQLIIYKDNDNAYQCEPCDGVTLTRARHCAPAKLEFKIPQDKVLDFTEGSRVQLSVNDTKVFLGYVFERARTKDNVISVLAYDQLRYFKNKECYQAKDKLATDVAKELCNAYQLKYDAASMANTVVKVNWLFDEKSLADIIDFCLGYSSVYGNGHPMYECYDDAGLIKISNCDSPEMKLDIVLDGDTVGDFSCTTSIDRNTYDMVKIVREAPADNNRTIMVKTGEVQDDGNILQWGRLQRLIKADENNYTPIEQAKRFLSLHDRKTRELRLKGCIGDVRVRGGSRVYVNLDFGDLKVSEYLFVTGVTHHFEQNLHTMDIDLEYVEPAGTYEVTYDNDAAVLRKIEAEKQKTGTGTSSGHTTSGNYSQNEQGAYSKLKSLGATDEQAAGILGNIRNENASYDGYAENDSGHKGLFQLSEDRWANYEKWCETNGNDPYNNDNQIEYVVTVENGNLLTGSGSTIGKIPDNADQAAKWFNDNIEVSETSAANSGNSSDRISSAQDILSEIQYGSITAETLSYPTLFSSHAGADSSLFDAGVQNVINQGNNYFGEDGCVRATTTLGSYYNTDLAGAVDANIQSVSGLETYMQSKGYVVEGYDPTDVRKGDILIWGDDDHAGIADGAGGCYANQTGSDYHMTYVSDVNNGWKTGTPPAKIIHV